MILPEILSLATIDGLSITTLSLCMIKSVSGSRYHDILSHEIKKSHKFVRGLKVKN
jgi:hypothetical protein